MDVPSLRTAFEHAVLWVCGLGIAAIALAYAGYLLARFPGKVRRSIRTYGLPTVNALAALMVFATIEGTPTNEDKERYRQQHQQQGGLLDPGQDGRVPGDPGTGSDSDADGLSGIMTLELGDDDYGTDGSDGATEGAGTIEAESLTLPDIRPLTESDYAAGIVLSQIGTDETHSFEPISGAEVCDDWRRFGAATDWFRCKWRMENEEWRMVLGTNVFDAVTVLSYGTVRPSMTNLTTFVSPFQANIGIVPEANWHLLSPTTTADNILHSSFSILHSQFWQALTPSNTFVMCWQNVPWNRDVHYPFSFMIEFEEKGDITFRYDLTNVKWRMENGEWVENSVLSNVCVGVMKNGLGRAFNALPTNVTSLKFAHLDPTRADDSDPDGDGLTTEDEVLVHHTDPYDADTDKDGLSDGREVNETHTDSLDPHSLDPRYPDGVAVVLGDLDPFDSPDGSTHTYLEHVFYTGTTNAPFAYPQSTDDTAVLRVSVSGTGSGELVVGDKVVPLLSRESPAHNAPRRARSTGGELTPPPNALLVTVVKGCDVRIYLRGDPSLALDLDSEDFAFGRLPNSAGTSASSYFVNFPNTKAETPCIHDFNARKKSISLSATSGASGLTAEWSGPSDVEIKNLPPRSAEITARFSARESSGISYEVDHPLYLFGRKHYDQTVRFCPRPSEEDDEDEDPDWYESGEGDPSDGDSERDEHWCCYWGVCGGDCGCGHADCSCANDSEDEDADASEPSVEICSTHEMPYEQCAPYHDGDYEAACLEAVALSDVMRIRDPLVYDRVDLPCPDEYRPCCPCPDHHTNHVSVVYKSYRLKVVDESGKNFSITNRPCSVQVAGCHPSSAIDDATLSFATNGVVFWTCDYTVLGMEIAKPEGASLAAYNALSRTLGLPMTVNTNLNHAQQLTLRTNVRLPFGNVRFSLEDTEGQFAVWVYDSRRGDYRKILDSEGRSVVNLPLSGWRRLLGYSSDYSSAETTIYVTSSAKGSTTMRFGYWGVSGGRLYEDWDSQVITSVNPALLPDYNRNGRIDESDIIDWANGRFAYFWSNDDTWRGDDAFAGYEPGVHLWPYDLPKNKLDMAVNGRNDLVNLCPLAIDLAELYNKWGGNAVYEFVTEDPGNVRFAFARTPWAKIGDVVKADQRTIGNEYLHAASLTATERDAHGEEVAASIPSGLLSLCRQGAGIVAVEFVTPNWRSLKIRVRKSDTGETLFVSPVNVQVCDVHTMYRWLNLDYACGAETDPKYSNRGYVTWPDDEHADANVIFVHGYNVHPDEAWDWSQAMFKRLWWSGMDAGFTAVLWRGNQSQAWVPGENAYATKNYHQNVLNAFRTASALKTDVARIPGARKYFIAHSLGNMLVSAARQDHGLQYEKYFMLNAAVAVEAYDAAAGVTSESKHVMTPPEWRDYIDRVRASHWYELFSPGDERNNLTWKGRFKDVDKTINFYSTQDEVVANGSDAVDEVLSRKFAWYNQEKYKGTRLVDLIPEAGWKFGGHYMKSSESNSGAMGMPVDTYRHYNATEAASINPESLKTRPLFRDFTKSEIYDENGSAYLLSNNVFRWRVLSHGIPAESFATGANPVPKWDGRSRTTDGDSDEPESETESGSNVNMATLFDAHRNNWIHSYFIKAPLIDTHQLFDRIVKEVK